MLSPEFSTLSLVAEARVAILRQRILQPLLLSLLAYQGTVGFCNEVQIIDMATLMLSVASGITFGSALTAAGVYAPHVIIDQMKLTDFHMLLAFLSASACSAIIIALANYSGYAKLNHRTDSSYGWFMPYDANIIGGALIGAGMSLTGACPGTVLVQLATGLESAWWVALGNVVGGIAFVKVAPRLKRSRSSGPQEHTVMQKTGLSTTSTVLLYEVMCLGMILGATYLPRSEHWLNPIHGGIVIGVAQVMSVLLTKKSLGVSSAYETIGKAFWSMLEGTAAPDGSSAVFALGLIAGAKFAFPYLPPPNADAVTVGTLSAIIGGVSMIFGARLAGGCTSGHGISGMSTMSFSSFITVAAMFGGGIITAAAL